MFFLSKRKIKQLINEVLMADLNIADALNAINGKLDSLAKAQAATVDLTPVLTAVQALNDKIDSIDTPTS